MGAVNRVPAAGEARSNLHVGGKAMKAELTGRDREICDAIGPAALACSVAVRLSRRRRPEELDVLALGRDRRTGWPAVDVRGANSRHEPAVEARVAALDGPVAVVVVEEHSPSLACCDCPD